jgi:hypothetical protein
MWWYNYRLGWVPKEAKSYLVMGDYLHGKLDIYYQLRKEEDSPTELWRMLEDNILEDMLEDGSNGEYIARALKTLNRYILQYAPKEDGNLKVIESELRFEYPMETPTGRPFKVEGYVDLLYKNKFGLMVVRDHKSSESGRFWGPKSIEADPQQSVYIACLRALGYDVWRGEVNFLNTHDYKDFQSQPIDKLFKTVGASRTQDELDGILLWLGKLVDRQQELTDPEMRRTKDCGSCSYYLPCTHKLKGNDDSTLLKLGFKRKDGYSEYHAAEANQNGDD